MSLITETDEDAVYLLTNLRKRAVRYANIRAGWDLKTREEKLDTDDERTSAHDAFIASVNMLSRYQKENGVEWLELLGKDDRKRLGDFACYMALFDGLNAR